MGRDQIGLLLAGAAILLGAIWIRTWGQPYLVAATLATVFAVLVTWGSPSRWWWRSLHAVLLLCIVVAWNGSRTLRQGGSERETADRSLRLSARVEGELRRAATDVSAAAHRMLEVSPGVPTPFLAIESRLPDLTRGEAAAVVSDGMRPYAWIGLVRLRPELMRDSIGLVRNAFYTVLYATAERGSLRALVMRTIHAQPPGDRLSRTLLGVMASGAGVERFDLVAAPQPGDILLAVGSDTAGWARPVLASAAVTRLRQEERTRAVVTTLLAIALLIGTGLAWRRPAGTSQRLAALAVSLAAVAAAPLNALSNTAAVFNPTYFFSRFGGPLTSNVAALAVTGLVASLAVSAITRSRRELRPVWIALPVAIVCVAGGPFLLRELARGITLPARGVPPVLWIAWEVALFLPAVALLMLGAWSADRVRGRFRLPPVIASTLAALSALLAPILLQAPGRFPRWYVVLWIVATGVLVLARRSRLFTFHTAFIAACAATTLVWGSVTRKRVELAQTDVASLATADPATYGLLDRLAVQVENAAVPATLADLLKIYVASDIASAGNPVELAVWRIGAERPDAELIVADLQPREGGERPLVMEVAESGAPALRQVASAQGIQLALAMRLDSSRALTVVAAPRTRLIEEDPFAALLGLDVPSAVEPAYRLTVSAAEPNEPLAGPSWARRDYELHGDWTIAAGEGRLRAHVEVELRSLDALFARGSLLVLLDLAVFAALWLLVATADGALRRWFRARTARWRRSYRARLTLALFAAFVFPSVAFAIWTYERLNDEDLLSRSLLVQETLRGVRMRDLQALRSESERVDLPVLWYRRGELAGASNPLYEELAPLGMFVDPVAAQDVVFGQEEVTNRRISVGPVPTLIGYRAISDGMVLATPARRSELTLERQQRDLLALLALALVIGAIIALWISGVAARAFARPIGALRRAAEDVAAGARDLPSLGTTPPPSEFTTVYGTFRQMAVDLSDSRLALEAAQRRTAAVLRDVGSGVVALNRSGRVILANPRAEQILGVSLASGDILARASSFLSEKLREFLAHEGEMESFDLELRGRQVRARLTRLVAGDGGAVLTIDDVTDLARAQRVFAWGEMARQIAHEIKNPLTPIRLGVQHVRRAYADAHPGFGEILERNVSRILQEIDRLDEIARAFAKFGTHPAEAATSDVIDVAAVAHDVVELERMGDSGVRWEVDAPEAVLAMSREAELREVLLNVLENARHANPQTVRVEVGRRDGGVLIAVADDGEGVSQEVMARAFEPHFSTRTSGSGLGLAISRRLVESWGGTIRLMRAEPRGTRVEIALVGGTPS
jgi:two-component system nitrogen regulation sensor histidine kinase NtrY